MDEDERTESSEEMNEENDAREEDIVEDTDSDPRDVEENTDENDNEISRRLERLESMVSRMSGAIDAMRDLQGIIVDNGATINDSDSDLDLSGVDDYVSPDQLNLVL